MQITMETSLGHQEANAGAELLYSKAAQSCKGMLCDSLQKQNIQFAFLSTVLHHTFIQSNNKLLRKIFLKFLILI